MYEELEEYDYRTINPPPKRAWHDYEAGIMSVDYVNDEILQYLVAAICS